MLVCMASSHYDSKKAANFSLRELHKHASEVAEAVLLETAGEKWLECVLFYSGQDRLLES